jgi:hypothetical protein
MGTPLFNKGVKMAKYIDLDGLQYLMQRIDAKYFDEAEVQSAINDAFASYKENIVTIVASLPATGEEGKLYLVPDSAASSNDIYTTYTWEEDNGVGSWAQMGSATFTPVTPDATVIDGSTNAVQGGAVYDELQLKLDASQLTSSISDGGTNAVTSGAIYTALDGKQDNMDALSNAEIDSAFVGDGEVWVDATGWTTLNVLWDTGSQTAPGVELTKNAFGYYVFDISDIDSADTLVFSDGTNATLALGSSVQDIENLEGKIITVTAGSSDMSVVPA